MSLRIRLIGLLTGCEVLAYDWVGDRAEAEAFVEVNNRICERAGVTTIRFEVAPLMSGGVPLTDELIEELAAEAEAGYDIDRLTNPARRENE